MTEIATSTHAMILSFRVECSIGRHDLQADDRPRNGNGYPKLKKSVSRKDAKDAKEHQIQSPNRPSRRTYFRGGSSEPSLPLLSASVLAIFASWRDVEFRTRARTGFKTLDHARGKAQADSKAEQP